MQAIPQDKRLRIFYSANAMPKEEANREALPAQGAEQLTDLRAQNFGIERLERLPFNIGHLALNAFSPAKAAAQSLGTAMTVLANTDALVIDLRRNGGDDPATVAMPASYFLDGRQRLNDIHYRDGDRTEQLLSSDFVIGTRSGKKKALCALFRDGRSSA